MSRTEQLKALALLAITCLCVMLSGVAIVYVHDLTKPHCIYNVITHQRVVWDDVDTTIVRTMDTYDRSFLSEDAAIKRCDAIEYEAITYPTPLVDSVWTTIEQDCAQ